MSSTTSAPDLGVEREIDLSRWRTALVERWWIIAAGLVAGIIVGALYSLSGGGVYEASVLVVPGQPFSPNGSPVLTYQASPRSIQQIVTGESALVRAAAAAHMPVGQLRGHVATSSIATGAGSTASRGSVLIQITVQSSKKKYAEDAANALGRIVVSDTTSPYVAESIATYESKDKSYNAQLASLATLIASYNKAVTTQNLDALNKLVLVTELDAAIARQGNLNDKLTANEQQLTLAKNIEIAQVIESAAARRTTARSRRNSIVFGALIGLIIGAIAAIVVDTRASRARRV